MIIPKRETHKTSTLSSKEDRRYALSLIHIYWAGDEAVTSAPSISRFVFFELQSVIPELLPFGSTSKLPGPLIDKEAFPVVDSTRIPPFPVMVLVPWDTTILRETSAAVSYTHLKYPFPASCPLASHTA